MTFPIRLKIDDNSDLSSQLYSRYPSIIRDVVMQFINLLAATFRQTLQMLKSSYWTTVAETMNEIG